MASTLEKIATKLLGKTKWIEPPKKKGPRPGLKRLRNVSRAEGPVNHTTGKPKYHCENCRCKRYTRCGCTKKPKT